jgi:orotidine-5'-phosphate decarboxylase
LAKLALETAEKYNDFVCGFITQRRLRSEPQESDDQFIYFTPGVHISTDKDNAGQTYRSPQQVVEEGSDVIIVGRGISGAEDPSQAAILYKEAGWAAYVKRMPN